MRPRAVLFDCDGVPVDSGPAAHAVLAESLTRSGRPIQPCEIERSGFTGGTMSSIRDRARAEGLALPDGWVSEIHAELLARLARGVALIAGRPLPAGEERFGGIAAQPLAAEPLSANPPGALPRGTTDLRNECRA